MSNRNFSKKICDLCKIKPKVVQDSDLNDIEVYPDFKNNTNKIKLIELLIKNDHIVIMSKDYYAIGNRANDFVDDCYNEYFEVVGSSLLEALYNYLTRWIKQSTSFKKEDGTMSEFVNTSYTLEREHCCFVEGFDSYLKDIKKIKKAIKNAKWEI